MSAIVVSALRGWIRSRSGGLLRPCACWRQQRFHFSTTQPSSASTSILAAVPLLCHPRREREARSMDAFGGMPAFQEVGSHSSSKIDLLHHSVHAAAQPTPRLLGAVLHEQKKKPRLVTLQSTVHPFLCSHTYSTPLRCSVHSPYCTAIPRGKHARLLAEPAHTPACCFVLGAGAARRDGRRYCTRYTYRYTLYYI